MNEWSVEFAKQLKARDNKTVIGAILGTVITPPPNIKISILEGQVFITSCYVLDYVLPDYERIVTMPFEAKSGELTIQAYDTKREDAKLLSSQDYKINEFELKGKKIFTVDTLKEGDEVMLITSQDNQTYFLVGKVRKLGE